MIAFSVYGMPGPQGSKRHVGGGRMIESSAKVKPWREAVKAAALAQIDSYEDHTGLAWEPMDGPLVAVMVFTLPKPASAPKKRQTWPDRKPDLSKLLRSTEDALVDAGLIADDARIVAYARAEKVFPGEDLNALRSPGAYIEIRRLNP